MDQTAEIQPNAEQPRKPKTVRILLIAAVIILAIATLLYFNIVPLKPSQQAQQNNQTVASIPGPTIPAGAKSVKDMLIQYIKDNIKPEFLPSDFKAIDIKILEEKAIFLVLPYATKNASISAYFRHMKNGNAYDAFSISVELKNNLPAELSADQANSLLSSYFIKPYTISGCKDASGTIICENFQTIPEGKKGYAVTLPSQSKLSPTLYTCSIPKRVKDFDTIKSCINP